MVLSLKILILVSCEPQVPCFFIFGDSLLDNGNNNDLNTQAKVNYPPYGIDFPDGPTGRFTNGKNQADYLSEFLGFENYRPPFASASGSEILQGVNYASGGSGIRSETGSNLGEVISLNQQLDNHQTTISKIVSIQRNNESYTQEYLKKCIYIVGSGSNDYMNNYFIPDFFPESSKYTPEQYADLLVQQYAKQITTLYNYGARKIALYGLGPIGCTPEEIRTFPTNLSGCVDNINIAVALYNDRMKPLVDSLNANLSDAHVTFINVWNFAPVLGLLSFTCCKTSTTVSKGQCVPNETPCLIRILRVFWDGFHPSETGHMLLAKTAYRAITPNDAYPIDIRHLAQL
ncbi:GDSL-lipase protein [Heracleum sosnowskyi]|uniref:GDSL-lipase protein n=1 Tax=Heracleum sosnowskyi TaxID=360622 RepID=A0AAD8I4U8_9APIA|nr:GDSL-lipase protein [Heracleum sosnowskyi]